MKSFTIKIVIFFLCFGLFSWISFTPCFGQGQQGKFGFGVKDIISEKALVISGRYWFSENFSLDANLGIQYLDPDKTPNEKYFLLGAGINQYLLPGEIFNPFVGIDLTLEVTDPGVGDSNTNFKLDAKFGGEYFFAPRFSLSGAVLFGLGFGDDTEIGTSGRLGVLFYLN